MRAREDLDVLHEPFMYHHYLTQTERLFPDFVPEPGHPTTYADIRDMIYERAGNRPIFFKDMAYYVVAELAEDIAFQDAMTHTFLVRDPAEAILSYQKRDPEFTSTELGLEAQFQLFSALRDRGLDPLVVTADQLRQAPEDTMRRYWDRVGLSFEPHAFSWDDSVPEGWKSVVDWHSDVLKSGSIKPPEERRDVASELAELGAPYTDYDRHHRPYFDQLKAVAETQEAAHQK